MPKPAEQKPLVFSYTNYRGELSVRSVIPKQIYFGSTQHHPEPQWLLWARDLSKNEDRHFAIRDCNFALVAEMTPTDWFGPLADAMEGIEPVKQPQHFADEWAQENPIFVRGKPPLKA